MLLHPPPRSWWPTSPKGFDRDPALGGDEHTVLEGVTEVVVRRRPARIEGGHRKDGPVPGQEDEAPAIRREGKEGQRHVEIQGRVQEVRVVVMGEGVVVHPEARDLAQEHADMFVEKLHEGQVHQARRRPPGLRQERDKAGREEGPGGMIDILAKAAQALDT